MRSSVTMMLLSIAAGLAWTGLPAARAQAGGAGECQVSGNLAADLSARQPQCTAQEQYAHPLRELFAGICDPDRCSPCWSFTAEGIALQRSTTRSQSLFDVSGTALIEVLNSKYLNFPVEMGPKLSAIRQLDCGPFAVEVAYFQVDGFAAEASVPGTSLMVTDIHGPHFIVTDATARYTSALYMGDVNLRWQWLDWLTLLGGFRMGQLNEHYHAAGTGTGSGEAVTLDVDAFNHLYGFQLGADADVLDLGGPLQIKGLCRAGAFGNFASQNIHRLDDVPPPFRVDDSLAATRSDHLAFLGEAGVVLTYAITERLAFRASYEVMWLEGVALAPEQIGASDFVGGTATVDAAGGVFYHGGGLGLEYRF